MNRSRIVLMVAWVFLAVGIAAQVVWPDSSSEETAAEEDQATDLAYTDRSFGDPDGGSPDSDSPNATSGASSADQGQGGVLADDPANWAEAGVVLPTESFVATVTTNGVAAMAEPELGAVQHWFPNPTQFDGDRAFLVIDQTSSPDWIKVSLPVMPNGQEGWIPRSDVDITTVNHRALVDLSDDSVTVWDGDEIIVNTKAVTGKTSTPTPLGVFYVRDIIAQQNAAGEYGPYILALSGFSEVLDTFDGGLPALAIHGTNNPDQIGTERSSGCVRIPNDLITLLADSVPLGTPVTVAA